jgi:hypothetical protein
VFQHLAARAAPGVVAFHVPTGGYRSPIEAKIFKGLGVKPGVSDVLAIKPTDCPHCGYGPLPMVYALELKAEGGRTSEAQLAFIAEINGVGGVGAVAVGLDRAIACLEAWRLLRGRVS